VNDILKQRLVGALILVALGVVFWPIIFVEPGEQPAAERASIPPRPQVDTAPIEAPELTGLRRSPPMAAQQEPEQGLAPEQPSQEREPEQAPVAVEPAAEPEPPSAVAEEPPADIAEKTPVAAAPVEEPRTRSEAPEKLALDSDGVPVAWILQVASVSSADKAEQLRQRLLTMQQKAYVKKVGRGGKDLYRVYIGPKFERAKLEKIQSNVDAEFGVKSMIARYIP